MTISSDARALVARTCAAQGVPETVTDPAVLSKVAAVLLAATHGNGAPKGAGTGSHMTDHLTRGDGYGSA